MSPPRTMKSTRTLREGVSCIGSLRYAGRPHLHAAKKCIQPRTPHPQRVLRDWECHRGDALPDGRATDARIASSRHQVPGHIRPLPHSTKTKALLAPSSEEWSGPHLNGNRRANPSQRTSSFIPNTLSPVPPSSSLFLLPFALPSLLRSLPGSNGSGETRTPAGAAWATSRGAGPARRPWWP